MMGLANGLNARFGRRKDTKNDFKAFCLSN